MLCADQKPRLVAQDLGMLLGTGVKGGAAWWGARFGRHGRLQLPAEQHPSQSKRVWRIVRTSARQHTAGTCAASLNEAMHKSGRYRSSLQ